MPISQVTLSNTFNEFRSTFNDAANTVNTLVPSANTISANTITLGSLTSGRVPVVSTAGLIVDDSALTYNTSTDVLTLGGATDASSSTTGAVIISGGVGIAKKLYVGTDLNVTANTTLSGTTESTSTTTGSLKTAGGLGVAKNLYVGGDMQVTGNLTILGSNTSISTTQVVIEDNILQLSHLNSADVVDIGFIGGYNNGANVHSGLFRDATDDTWKLFRNYTAEPSTTIDVSANGFAWANLAIGQLTTANNVNVATGQSYQVNGTNVLNATTLGSSVVTSSLTSVGTITSGNWNGTTISVANGGTGVTSSTGTGSTVLSALPTFAGAIVSVTDNTNAALRITQLGTGNALLVEDTTNPDASPFVIDASGRVIVGGTAPITGVSSYVPPLQVSTGDTNSSGMGVNSFSSGSGSGFLHFNRSKSSTVGTNALVASDDIIGNIVFAGADGTGFIRAATIEADVDGTPGTNDMPGRLVFSTTADGAATPTERMRIDSSGNVGIGNAAANVNDQVGAARPLLVSKSDAATTVAGSQAAIVIGNSDTTANNTSQLSFAAITGASGTFYTSAAINCIFGARTNGQYPTGQLVFSTSTSLNSAPTEKMRIDSSGNVGIGGSAGAYTKVDATGNYPTSSATTIVYNAAGTVPSGTTATARIYGTSISIAASTTVASVQHFYAQSPALLSGAAITNQYGFLAESNLTNATNNYGFFGNIASGTGRYNLYMAGTAANYLGGALSVAGDTTLAAYTETIVASGTVGSTATLAITAGTVLTATLTSATACTFTMPTATAGKSFILLLKQPASGTATTATFTSVKWGSAGAPTITATVGKLDILSFASDGTNWYGSAAQGYTY